MAEKQRVAIVHDWLVGGGAERVVLELHRLYPDAPVYTSYCTPEWRAKLDNTVVTGFLQRWPFGKLRKFVGILRIWWFSHLDLSQYDLVISSSGNGEAFGVKTNKQTTTHICYCHTPTHYYWRHYNAYMQSPGFGVFSPLARFGLWLLVGPLRLWDLAASKRPDYYIANSEHIKADIATYYGRDSVVIHPPVDVDRFAVAQQAERHGFLVAGRLVPQKRFDLVIEACNRLKLPLTVIGKGPEYANLKKIAGPTITFAGFVPDADIPRYFAEAKALVFPSFEDFGIVPVEAMAAGTPVVALRVGGALDYVVEGKTGTFFTQQTVDSICEALQRFPSMPFNHDAITKAASEFSPAVFDAKMTKFIASVIE